MRYKYLIVGALLVGGMVGCQDAMERTLGYRDEKITAEVETALKAGVPGNTINVNTREGVVTLSGTVPDASARERAGQIAMETKGVERVNNNVRAPVAADAPAMPPVPPAPQLQ